MGKVLIVNPWTGKIGPNTFLKGLVHKLLIRGNEVILVYPYKDELSEELRKSGCSIHYIKQIKLKHINNYFIKLLNRFYSEFFLFMFLFYLSAKKKLKFNYYIFNTEILSFSMYGISKNIPGFIIVHALSFNENKNLSKLIFKIQQNRVCKYVAVSNAVVDVLTKSVSAKDVLMVYNGIDVIHFSKSNLLKRQLVNPIVQILSVLHPVPHKGAHHLIEALAIIQEKGIIFCCTIVGWYNDSTDIKYRSYVEALIFKYHLEDKIYFQPFETDIRVNYSNSDMLVHPSENESFGYVLVEAMAFELPIVAFGVGGIIEVIENNVTGFLIQPYDTLKMAEAIFKLIKSKRLSSSLGKGGRERVVGKFTLEKNMRTLIDLFEENSNRL